LPIQLIDPVSPSDVSVPEPVVRLKPGVIVKPKRTVQAADVALAARAEAVATNATAASVPSTPTIRRRLSVTVKVMSSSSLPLFVFVARYHSIVIHHAPRHHGSHRGSTLIFGRYVQGRLRTRPAWHPATLPV
jgi:hypothetical protein